MRRRHSFMGRVSQTLEIPSEIFQDVPRLEMVGRVQFRLENHRGVHRYRGNEIVFLLPQGRLQIQGENLVISWMDHYEVVVTGELHAMRFVDADRRQKK